MATADAAGLMTADELLALSDDGTERTLIRGQLREKPMTVRRRCHSLIMAEVVTALNVWAKLQPAPRPGRLRRGRGAPPDRPRYAGRRGRRLRPGRGPGPPDRPPDPDRGGPFLIVEILSPDDTQQDVTEMLQEYRTAGVPLVWLVDPDDQTVTVYERGAAPLLFNVTQDLTAEPHLPGFRVAVRTLFD